MTHDECKVWFAYHAAAFPAFERVYSGLRKASTQSAHYGWNFIMRDLEDVTLDEAKIATDYMRSVNSQMKPEQHSREVARIAISDRIKRREESETWDCNLCRDSGTALIFSGCCPFLMRHVHDVYWKKRQDKDGNPIPPDPRWKFQIFGIPCCCSASQRGNEWLYRHQSEVVTAWYGVGGLSAEDRLAVESGGRVLASSWQTGHREEFEF